MRRIYIQVSQHTLDQLAEVAERERRDVRQQAAYILEQAAREANAAPPILDLINSEAGYVLADPTGFAR
jgi:hypothetical protein